MHDMKIYLALTMFLTLHLQNGKNKVGKKIVQILIGNVQSDIFLYEYDPTKSELDRIFKIDY